MASVLIPAVAGVLLALLCLPRLRKVPRQAAPEPEQAAAVTAVVEPRPSASATRPFAYDNGVTVEEQQ